MIVIVDYGMGNLGSIHNMLHRLGVESLVSGEPREIAQADRLILPGVGAFDVGMRKLHSSGLIPHLEAKVLRDRTPLLGICLGMQLLSLGSEEGKLPGLAWIESETVRFRFENRTTSLTIPHMGWSEVRQWKSSPLLDGMYENPRFYFVHGYHVRCHHNDDVWLTCEYGMEFVAAVQHRNIIGVQFHPEKSHKFGMKLLENFSHAT